ncbi:MAG: membrane protein insertion efficiency factor YidD [Burkholderiaceae bacterium]
MIKEILIAAIRGYRFVLSPWLGNACRYWPTCSEYSMQAIESHGTQRGGWLMLARLARCHPYGAGGVDPVPLQFTWRCWCQSKDAGPPLCLTSIKSDHEH